MPTRRLRSAVIAVAAAASLGAAVVPAGASASHHASGHHASGRHAAARVRSYDNHLLSHSNHARTSNHRHDYKMNPKLWKIAHRWAKHLAATGTLAHNPRLASQITKSCPSWTAIGENVGVVYGGGANQLFQAYMHSPEHRANILDPHYTKVGIATVKVTVNGQLQQWDVMDFGNHC
jgi:uncharacterized protein YkwD